MFSVKNASTCIGFYESDSATARAGDRHSTRSSSDSPQASVCPGGGCRVSVVCKEDTPRVSGTDHYLGSQISLKASVHKVSLKYEAFVRLLRVSSIHFVPCEGRTVQSRYTSTKVAGVTCAGSEVIARASERRASSESDIRSNLRPLESFGRCRALFTMHATLHASHIYIRRRGTCMVGLPACL